MFKRHNERGMVCIYVKVTIFLPPFAAGRLEQCDDGLVEGRLLPQGSVLCGKQWTGALAPMKKKKKKERMIKFHSLLMLQTLLVHAGFACRPSGGFNQFCPEVNRVLVSFS